MIYLVDGYNLFFPHFSDEAQNFSKQRHKALKAFCSKSADCKLPIVLVLDAHSSFGETSRLDFEGIELVYTREGQSADEFIIDSVQRARTPGQLIVVSGDKALARSAKSLGSQTLSPEEFYSVLEKKAKPRDDKQRSSSFSEQDLENYHKIFSRRLKNE